MTACLMALNALAIDVMLPAMFEIGRALNVSNPNDAQFIVVVYMFGFGFSQLVWGPVTDRFGRKRRRADAYVLFSLGCTLAQDFTSLLIWRFASALRLRDTCDRNQCRARPVCRTRHGPDHVWS